MGLVVSQRNIEKNRIDSDRGREAVLALEDGHCSDTAERVSHHGDARHIESANKWAAADLIQTVQFVEHK